jgi:gentisate 1,2-dioxygenase
MAQNRKDKLAEINFWDRLMQLRDRQREERRDGMQVIKEGDLPLEVNQQGLMRWYLHPDIRDTVISTLMFFQQEIPPGSNTGKLKFQGGQVIMILEGKGYTTVDGVRHAWEAGDVVNLPLRPEGITVQHFNTDLEKRVKFVASEPNLFECVSVDRGSGFEQIENAPEYRNKK